MNIRSSGMRKVVSYIAPIMDRYIAASSDGIG